MSSIKARIIIDGVCEPIITSDEGCSITGTPVGTPVGAIMTLDTVFEGLVNPAFESMESANSPSAVRAITER